MRNRNETKHIVDIRLAPSTVFIFVQFLLIHYKLTNAVNFSWVYAMSPFLMIVGLVILGGIYQFWIQLLHIIRKLKK